MIQFSFNDLEQYERATLRSRIRHGLAQEAKAYLRPTKGWPETQFVILAQDRTGSTLLTTLLNNHPDIHCDREIFYYPRAFPLLYARRLAAASGARCYGFKVKIYQINEILQIDPHDFLTRICFQKIIHLKRNNVVRHVFSNYFAEKSGQFHFDKLQNTPDLRFHIEPDGFLALCDRRLRHAAEEKAALEGKNVLKLSYERDLLAADARSLTADRLTKFLGVARYPLSTHLDKSVQKPPAEFVTNVHELHARLVQSPFAQFADSLYGD